MTDVLQDKPYTMSPLAIYDMLAQNVGILRQSYKSEKAWENVPPHGESVSRLAVRLTDFALTWLRLCRYPASLSVLLFQTNRFGVLSHISLEATGDIYPPLLPSLPLAEYFLHILRR